jgi:hypothetical protein
MAIFFGILVKIFEEVFIIMYLNTSLINQLEEMCLNKKTAYYGHRMFSRSFSGFGHFMDEMDMHEEDRFYKKYDLSKIEAYYEFEMCLGVEFLNMDLSMLDMKNKKRGYTQLLNAEDDDRFMKAMLHRHRGQDKEKLENSFEIKVMRFERNLQIIFHNMHELFLFQSMLNCSPLVNEWLDFAKKHKINIDDELKEVLSFIEKDKGGFKLYENLMEEFKPLKRKCFKLMKKSQSVIRRFWGDSEHTVDKEKESVEIELLQEIDFLEFKIKEFSQKIKDVSTSMNKDNFNEADVAHNNNLLIEGLFKAYQKLKHKIELPNTYARSFINFFINEKDDPNLLERLIKLHNNNVLFVGENIKYDNKRYQKVIVFSDYTCIVLADDQSEFEIFANIKEFKNLVKTCLSAYLKKMLRKNPSIGKVIEKKFCESVEKINNSSESGTCHDRHSAVQFNKILLSIDTYFKNENILKSLKYDFMETCKKATSFEKVDDDMHKLIREHKIKKFAESIVSSKYKHLYNKESYKLFQELYDLSIDTKALQEMLGKKLAAVETSVVFNDNIKKLINSLNEFDMVSVKLKANSHGVKIIADENEILILEIENFVQSQKLGSASWCISRNQSYFEQYTEKGGKQYFIYDFNQESKSVKSLVGITLTKAFKVKAAHSKSDSQFKDKKMIDYLIEKVKPIEVEKKPAATRKPRAKKVVTAPEIAIPNIGF